MLKIYIVRRNDCQRFPVVEKEKELSSLMSQSIIIGVFYFFLLFKPLNSICMERLFLLDNTILHMSILRFSPILAEKGTLFLWENVLAQCEMIFNPSPCTATQFLPVVSTSGLCTWGKHPLRSSQRTYKKTLHNNRFDASVPSCAKLSNRATCPCCRPGLRVPGTDIERYRSITCSIRA